MGFDYVGPRRGHWAQLQNGGWTVTLCEYPSSLMSMAKAKVLCGEALRDAEDMMEKT